MKKWLYALLAISLVFVLGACGGGGGSDTPGGGGFITISFAVDSSYLTLYSGTVPNSITIPSGSSLGTRFPAALTYTGQTPDTVFLGWYNGATKASSTTVFNVDTTLTAKFGTDPRLIITFKAVDENSETITTYRLEAGESFTDAGYVLPLAPTRDGEWQFGGWKRLNGGDAVTLDSSFQATQTVVGNWWSTTLTAEAGDNAEKLWLTNSGFAVFAFDITGKDVTKIKNVSATYKVSEAALEGQTPRPMRIAGPYFFGETSHTTGEGEEIATWYGDFMIDPLGAYITKWNSGDAVTIAEHNKFHPYLLDNGPSSWADIRTRAGGVLTANTWFTFQYNTSGYTGAPHSAADPNNIPKVMSAVEAANTGNAVLPADTDYDTVYFAIGIPKFENAHDATHGYRASVWTHGITSLVKDVKIVFDDNTEVTGTKPALPVFDEEGNKTTGTTDQVFSGYAYAIQYNWRGAPSAPINIPADPTYEPPLNPDIVPATQDYTVNLTALASQSPLKNEEAFTRQYAYIGPWAITFPAEGLDVRSYSSFTVKGIAYAGDGVTVLEDVGSEYGYGMSLGQVEFLYEFDTDKETPMEEYLMIGRVYNLNIDTIKAEFPSSVLEMEVARGLRIALLNSSAEVKFLQLTEITFHK